MNEKQALVKTSGELLLGLKSKKIVINALDVAKEYEDIKTYLNEYDLYAASQYHQATSGVAELLYKIEPILKSKIDIYIRNLITNLFDEGVKAKYVTLQDEEVLYLKGVHIDFLVEKAKENIINYDHALSSFLNIAFVKDIVQTNSYVAIPKDTYYEMMAKIKEIDKR